MRKFTSFFLLVFLYGSCQENSGSHTALFDLLPVGHTGIDFQNTLTYNEQINPYTFRNFYNGAGVALGDINGDGLLDIYFAGNQVDNKLYLNKGKFEFEDITETAGVACGGTWSTGVSMADVNGDGLLDIFVCKSGPPGGVERYNQLFINNGDLTFTDQSMSFGLDDQGLSQHAVFFDYDKDGDLDMYLLNNSLRSVGIFDLREGQREKRDSLGGNKLYRNDGGRFTDVSEEAGIYGSIIGYGLGVTVSDINKDGWPDLYVSNDFFEKDYLYINTGNGTFTESLEEMMTEINMGAMGADIADLNNNGWPDIFVTEMLPQDWARIKTKTPFEDWDKYQANVRAGYYHQFTRNTLQQNLGPKPGTSQVHFREISRMAGVHATDWSWGALIFDADNDGWKDIFVANGIAKDLTDFDFVDFYANDAQLISQYKKDSILLTQMIDELPSQPFANFFFKNQGNMTFQSMADSFGLGQLTFSNGAAYGDLDNDGDLDLVVSNINGPAMVFRNKSDLNIDHRYLQLDLVGGFGTKVEVYADKNYFYQEHYPVKGYMSSMDHKMTFGLGKIQKIDSVIISWPNGYRDKLEQIPMDTLLAISPTASKKHKTDYSTSNGLPLLMEEPISLPYSHIESDFVDFDRDRLRFFMISNEGPAAAVADFNGDGRDDLIITGAKGQATELFFQQDNGTFSSQPQDIFDQDALAEDVAICVFDATGNGFPDIYVGSGGIEFGNNLPIYQDRLYLNDGSGNFQPANLPQRFQSTSFVKTLDFNQDGKMDLIVGTRAVPYLYGLPVDMILLENKGDGSFVDVTSSIAPSFRQIGLTRDALVADFDGDGMDEILVSGEWMPLRLFKWLKGEFVDVSAMSGLENTWGLWQGLAVGDFNGDGAVDFVAGNYGKNTRLKATDTHPLRLYINDFDQNGSVEHILTMHDGQKEVPVVLKNDLVRQMPQLRKILPKYASYKDKTLADLFPAEILQKSLVLEANTLLSKLFLNNGDGTFETALLPDPAQVSPLYAIWAEDLTGNGHIDLLLGGNQSRIKPEMGTNMASYGSILENQGNGKFSEIEPAMSGVYVPGETRQILPLTVNGKRGFLYIRNNASPIWKKFIE